MRKLTIAALLFAPTAQARESPACAREDTTWVELAFEGDEAVGTRVRQELEVELEGRDIALCTQGPGKPVAHLEVTLASDTVRLVVRDRVTAKIVERTVDLSKLAADARPVGITLAIDELLRASWAELLVEHDDPAIPPPTATKAPPAAVEKARAIVRASAPAVDERGRIAVEAVADGYLQSQPRFGVDVRMAWMPVSWLSIGLRLGYRRSVTAQAPDGTVDADAFVAGGELEVALTARRPFRVWSFAGFDASRVVFRGTALPGASGASQGATAIDAIAGARLGWMFHAPFELSVRLGVGAPLLRAEATDQGKVVAGTSGALIVGSLGTAFLF